VVLSDVARRYRPPAMASLGQWVERLSGGLHSSWRSGCVRRAGLSPDRDRAPRPCDIRTAGRAVARAGARARSIVEHER
jgi:hypothetical protein